MDRRDVLKGLAALPVIGINPYSASATTYSPPRMPRHLFQLGLTTTDLDRLRSRYAKDVDTILKAEKLIPQDAVLEKVFDCVTQDCMVFRWQHKDFTPVINFDSIYTMGPSDDWRRILGISSVFP